MSPVSFSSFEYDRVLNLTSHLYLSSSLHYPTWTSLAKPISKVQSDARSILTP